MKTIFLTFSLFLMFNILSFSQDNILFRDDFDNNQNNWSELNNNYVSSQVKNGVYSLQFKTVAASSWRFWKSIFLNPQNDCYIEAKFTQISGNTDYGYGIVWGADNWQNNYNFVVASSGYFKVYAYKKEQLQDLQDWKKYENINGIGVSNTLAVHKRGNLIYFYINGVWVHSIPNKTFFGSDIGFVVTSNMTVNVDYLLIKHPSVQINTIPNSITHFPKRNLGRNVNSTLSDIAPIISADGKTLYFAREETSGKFDVYFSTLQADSTWSAAQNIGKPFNNSGDNVVISVSPDNNSLLLEGLYNPNGSFKGDNGISISYRTANGWSVPQQIKIKNYYNLDIYESFCHSSDKKVLLMSVERTDSYGGKDMYVSFLQENGEYSEPKNLGNVLNTFASEGTPFLAPDNVTLYFYSEGRAGFGSADIYVTKRLDSTWLNWSEPQNLGTEINSSNWDTYYSVSAKGNYAFLVSSNNTFGEEDIFEIKLPEAAQPNPVVLIYGKVFNAKTNSPIGAKISYDNLSTNQNAGYANSDSTTGNYKIVLPYGVEYGFRAAVKGFIPVDENINLTQIQGYQEIERNLFLVPIEVGQIVQLKNVFFKRSQDELLPTSFPQLLQLVQILKENPSMCIELSGHTDNVGDVYALLDLSERRVEKVKIFLVSKGISADRIRGVGCGDKLPIAPNDSEENKAKNRRVEFKIISK